jgi:hypothetical protein
VISPTYWKVPMPNCWPQSRSQVARPTGPAAVGRSRPCEQDVRVRLASFNDWCAQNDDIAELLTLARTISRWEDEIVAAVLTVVTNAAPRR